MRRLAVARPWKWSTLSGALTDAKTALGQLQMYTNETNAVLIGDDPEFRSAKQAAEREEKLRSGKGVGSTPMTAIDHANLLQKTQKDPELDLFYCLQRTSLGRPEDIAPIRATDCEIRSSPNKEEDLTVTLTIRTGKRAKRKGPYGIIATIPRRLTGYATALIGAKMSTNATLFGTGHQQSTLKKKLRETLRSVNEVLDLGSIRKGAAVALAEGGTSLRQLQQLMVHQDEQTTLRYLNYKPTAQDRKEKQNWSKILL